MIHIVFSIVQFGQFIHNAQGKEIKELYNYILECQIPRKVAVLESVGLKCTLCVLKCTTKLNFPSAKSREYTAILVWSAASAPNLRVILLILAGFFCAPSIVQFMQFMFILIVGPDRKGRQHVYSCMTLVFVKTLFFQILPFMEWLHEIFKII